MNQYLQSMKNAVADYHKKAQAADAEIKKTVDEYKPEIAKERVADIRSRLTADKAAAIDSILDAQKKGAADYAEKWERIRVEDITPDAKLLDIGITMTQAQYDELCRKYTSAGNNTMCRLLNDYADKNNKRLAQENPGEIFPRGYLTRTQLPSVEDNEREWDRAAKSAERLIDQMSGNGYMQGANNGFVAQSVEHFGENINV